MALIGQVVSEKKLFEYYGHIHVYSPREGADNPLGRKYFHKHKSSVHLLIPSTFSAIKWHFLFFPIQMHGQPKLTLPQKRSWSSQGHDLYKLCRATFPDASCQVSKSQTSWFSRRSFLKVFCYLQPWQPSWSCDLDHLYKLSFTLPKDAPHKVWL